LNILDAITAMEGNGPIGGTPRNLNFIAVSKDATALDIIASKTIGYPFETLQSYISAKEIGVGYCDLKDIEIVGNNPEDFYTPDFELNTKPPVRNLRIMNFLLHFIPEKPVINHNICTRCQVCKKMCSSNAIENIKGKMIIDYKKCIRCFCCQEFCEYSAIKIEKPFIRRIISRIKKRKKN